jgi:hypothetical protein
VWAFEEILVEVNKKKFGREVGNEEIRFMKEKIR